MDPNFIHGNGPGALWPPGTSSCAPGTLGDLNKAGDIVAGANTSGDSTTKANTAPGTSSAPRKTVIADLTRLGYFLQKSDPAKEYYEYVNFELWEVYSSKGGVGIAEPIDKIGVPNVGKHLGFVILPLLCNKGFPGDTNPNRVPLRDIILSLWQSKTNRSVKELHGFKYINIVEADTVAFAQEACWWVQVGWDAWNETPGKTVVLKRNAKSDREAKAFASMEKCVFAIGLTKLSQEYAEFKGRQVEQFMLEVPPQETPDEKAHNEKKNVNEYTEDELLRGWDLTIFMTCSPKE